MQIDIRILEGSDETAYGFFMGLRVGTDDDATDLDYEGSDG